MKRYTSLIAAGLMLAAVTPLRIHAAVNTWNNGAANFLWNTTSANWTSPTIWADGDDAIFGATGVGTVTLGTPVTVQNQTFSSAGYTIAGGGNALTLTGTTPTITANANISITASLSGTSGLTVQGTSVLRLLGDLTAPAGNSFTGGAFVKSGTLVLQVSNLINGTSYAIDSIAALDAGATVRYFNDFDGVNNIRVPEGQIPVSDIANRQLNLTGGTLDLNGDDNQNRQPLPSGTGAILNGSPYSRAVLKMTGDGNTHTFSGSITDGGPVTNSPVTGKLSHRMEVDFAAGSGTLILAGSNSFSGFIRIGTGNTTIQLSGAGTLGYPTSENCPGRQVLQNNGVIDLNGTSQKTGFYFAGAPARITNSAAATLSTLTLCFNCTNLTAPANSGIICSIQDDPASGLIGITKEGTALQNLNGANNNYHGDTVVNNGNLRIDQAGAISPNSTYRLSTSQGTLELNYAGDALVRGLYVNGVEMPAGTYGSSTAPITGTGTITVPPPNTWNNASGDSLWNGTSANWTLPTTWVDGGNAIFGATGAGPVTNSTPVSAHSLTFSAAGYAIHGEGNALTLVDSGATITANAGTSNYLAVSILGTSGVTFKGTGTTVLAGDASATDANHYTGGTYIRSGKVILQAVGANTAGTSYAVDSIEALDAGATLVIPGIFNGTAWANVRDQIATAVPGSQLKMTGGTLDLFDEPKNQRIPVPDGTGLIHNTGTNVQAGLIMVADGQNRTFSGVIADGGPLVGDNVAGGPTPQGPGRQIGIVSFAGSKNGGGGLWTLTGSNTYSGSTRIDQGASIKLVGNGTIGFPTASLSFTGPMRIYGSATDATRGYLDLNGHNQTIALMQNGNPDAKVFNSAVGTVSTLTFGYGNEQVARTASFQFMDNQGTGGVLALKKVATGPAFITPGSGVPATNCSQTLSGVNTYSGDTTVAGGHLVMATASAVSPNSAFRLSTIASQPSPDSSVSLILTYDGTANVRQLWIDGVQQPNGVYGAGTPGINPNSTGTLTVTGSAPVSLGASQSGNSLTFSWQGVYKLQTKTNNIIGPWFDYPSGGTSPVNVPVDHSKGSVFFRLSPF